jgi:hypothetical protein
MKIRAKNKQNIHDLQLSFIKIGGFSLNFAEWVVGFILKRLLFIGTN